MRNKKNIMISAMIAATAIGLYLFIYNMASNTHSIEFKPVSKNSQYFHEINAAERINNGILYYYDTCVIYEKDGGIILAINYESTTELYKYDGCNIKKNRHA